MGWKNERWIAEVFPGEDKVYAEYRSLPGRELVIVAAAVLDAALAELLHRRFREFPGESERFLGVNGDGRAPVASLGARIQLGLLIGILTEADAAVLCALKNLRNSFAHRVNADFLSEPALGQTRALLAAWQSMAQRLFASGAMQGSVESLREIERHLGMAEEAGEGLVLAVLATYQAYFQRLESRIASVDTVA